MVGVVTPGASRFRLSHSVAIWRPTSSQSPRSSASRIADRGIANPLEAVEDVPVAVEVTLGDLPVVRPGIARRAGVGEHDARCSSSGGSTSRPTRWMPLTPSSIAAMPP